MLNLQPRSSHGDGSTFAFGDRWSKRAEKRIAEDLRASQVFGFHHEGQDASSCMLCGSLAGANRMGLYPRCWELVNLD